MCAFPPLPVRPARTLRLLSWDGSKGSVRITDKGKAAEYAVEHAPSDWGEAFYVLKTSEPGCEVYAVLLADDGFHRCDCKGCARWKTCRHIEALLALKAKGRI